MKKRILSALIATVLAFTTAVASTAFAVSDDSNGSVYYSQDNSYVANKITHYEQGTKTNDGIVDYVGNGVVTDDIKGAGCRTETYAWSALGYGDYVYIGTCPNAMMSTLQFMKSVLGDNYDEETMKLLLNTMFNGHFFINEEDGGDPKGVLVKLNTKTGDVKLLMSKATTDTNVQFRNGVEYNGMLYFCGSVNGLPSVYQVNPKTDECKKVYQSISAADYYAAYKQGICVGIRGICVYEGKLIVSLVGMDGAYICESDNPSDPDSFKVIADMDDLFNYPAYHYTDSIYGGSIWDMAEFNNSLYVVVCTGTPENKPDKNSMQSFAIVRGDRTSDGNWNWTCLAGDQEKDNAKYTFGIDPERTRSGAANICVYNDYLYIGEYNDEEIAIEDILFSRNCNFVNANLEQSVNLYRMDKDENIELVAGNSTEMFPDGSITGYGSGFDRNENQYIWRMQVYNDKLYVGTFDTSSLLEPIGQFTNGDITNMTPEEWEKQIDYITELIKHLQDKKDNPSEKISASSIDNSFAAEEKAKIAHSVNRVGASSLNTVGLNKANGITKELSILGDELDESFNQSFLDKYEELLKQIADISGTVPDEVIKQFEKLINAETAENMKSITICAAYLGKADRGFDLYIFDDKDLSVETVTTNGFGDPYNHGCRVFAENNTGLVLGTANPFYGTQIWSVGNNVEYSKYDVDRDGKVDINDATYMQKVLVGIEGRPFNFSGYGDVNGDGRINISDATEIQMYLAGIL